ncbi:MAG: hypothetical protein OXH89_05655, partial [bacterium]|nr:hypothetical protein [bacterium]
MTVVALVAAVIAAVWVWRILPAERPGSVTRAEASASYYPEDAVAYAWLDLAPGESPPGGLPFLFDQLEGVGGFAGEGDNTLPDAVATFLGDLGTWIGTELSAAVVELENGEIAFAATVGVSDRDAAAESMRSWLQHQEQSTSAFIAQAGDFLLFGTDEGLLDEVSERIDGNHPETLASAGHFEEARAAARDGRFASAYVNLEWLAGRMGDPGRNPCAGVPFDTPEWLMVSASWVGDGLVVDLATPDVTSWWTDTSAGVTDAVVPADALGFVSVGFDPNMDRWWEILGGCEMADLLPGGYLFDQPSAQDTSGL